MDIPAPKANKKFIISIINNLYYFFVNSLFPTNLLLKLSQFLFLLLFIDLYFNSTFYFLVSYLVAQSTLGQFWGLPHLCDTYHFYHF